MSSRTLPLDDNLWHYLLDHSLREHPELAALRAATQALPQGRMQISPEQGALMQLLVKLLGAQRTLEVGVFTGYSALAVALALPGDGRLLACELNSGYTALARPYWERAGVSGRIELVHGHALETLDGRLARGERGQYDFAFIDADKVNYDAYYERCLELVRPGGLLAIDNVFWSGRVTLPVRPERDPDTAALQRLNDKLHQDPRVELAMVPIGDGLTLARKA